MANSKSRLVPACRFDTTPDQLQREADRAVLYGACLLLVRPQTRIKAQLDAAVRVLVPSVQAYYDGSDAELADHAIRYADACGGRAFLEQKAALFRVRQAETQG